MIKVVLLLALLVAGLVLLRRRRGAGSAAGRKILLGLFVVGFVISVLFPDVTTWLAQLVGVGRGADLLLYGLVLAFVFVTLNVYLRFQDQRRLTGELARAIAVREAAREYGVIRTQPTSTTD